MPVPRGGGVVLLSLARIGPLYDSVAHCRGGVHEPSGPVGLACHLLPHPRLSGIVILTARGAEPAAQSGPVWCGFQNCAYWWWMLRHRVDIRAVSAPTSVLGPGDPSRDVVSSLMSQNCFFRPANGVVGNGVVCRGLRDKPIAVGEDRNSGRSTIPRTSTSSDVSPPYSCLFVAALPVARVGIFTLYVTGAGPRRGEARPAGVRCMAPGDPSPGA